MCCNYMYNSKIITLMLEAILIKDDNTAETTLFHSQASSVASSLFSAEKVMCTSDFNLVINDINIVYRAIEKSETYTVLLQEQLTVLEFLADLEF
ncbi:hypothetical protein BDDG_05786 [Blastomyces dermatitidis ATCC 18188]|uniref:Uncharacterized protein n=1 Tax=Ajellomyces dermatitidis (strain ATCC 18188 / CBS 674.68) TaxID=653446 RepID=F2THZ2_AJEDA|nr:hypothetical protein BDDG_05786 [Blastomyces dermatitidis ATCC 18188]